MVAMVSKRAMKTILLGMCLLGGGCAAGNLLTTRGPAEERAIGPGVFKVILYGGKHANDLETVAFLDIDGDAYTLKPYGAQFNFTEYAGQEGLEAYNTAKEFVGSHIAFKSVELREIIGPQGGVIGYEIRPLYRSFEFGTDDVLDVTYELTAANYVQIYVRLQESVQRRMESINR